MGAVFFLDTPATCHNCTLRPPFDMYVDVTASLRARAIDPRSARLEVLVEMADGDVVPAHETRLPPPVLRGPSFASASPIGAGQENPADDVGVVQALLAHFGLVNDTGACCADADGAGVCGEATIGAIRAFQRAAGLVEDGVCGALTRMRLTTVGLATDTDDGELSSRLEIAPGARVAWTVDMNSAPAYLDDGALIAELDAAFDAWGRAAGVTFERQPPSEGDAAAAAAAALSATIAVRWGDLRARNAHAFDGPGGALARAACTSHERATITFDAAEKWELGGADKAAERRRAARAGVEVGQNGGAGAAFWADATIFRVLPVALHEIGHCIVRRRPPCRPPPAHAAPP